MTFVRVGLEYDRTVPESWERAVWAIAPPSHFVSWLKLRWEPGDAWEPIERWMIWQMRSVRMMLTPKDGKISPHAIALVKELRGPDPRSTGHYCAPGYCMCAIKRNAWRGGAARLIDHMQWKLFQETGHFGTRWWCIQGDQGGHRHRLDKIEAKVSRLRGGPSDTPAPGDLPYADFDLRTFRKIAELDRVRMWKGVTDYVDRNHATLNAEERDEGERAQWAMWSWLESQVKQTVDKIGRSGVNALRDAAPRVLGKPTRPLDEEAIQRDFIIDHDN